MGEEPEAGAWYADGRDSPRARARTPENARGLRAATAVFVVASLAACSPVITHLFHWGIQDWDQHTLHHAVARQAIVEFGEAPLWNPYNDGGVPLLANPESRALAPTFALTLAFGEIVGPKLEIVLHQLLAMLGAAFLAMHFGIAWVGASIAGLVFGLNTWYSIHLTVGHTWALNIAYAPWVLLCQRRSLQSPAFAIPTAALLVVMFFGGGVYPLVMTLLLMLLFACADGVAGGHGVRRQLQALALTAAVALPLGSVKLLPAIEHAAQYPRHTPLEGGYTPASLLHALADRDQSLSAAAAERRHEFTSGGRLHHGLYVGIVPLLLLAYGAVSRPRRAAPLLAVALVPLWIALGVQVQPSLWATLHALPVLDSLRMPQRFGIASVLPACLVVGLGVEALAARLASGRARALTLGAVSCVVFADLVVVNRSVFAEAFPIPPFEVARSEVFRQRSHQLPYDTRGFTRYGTLTTTTSGLYPAFLANLGTVDGYQVVPVPRNAIGRQTPGYRGEVFLDDAQDGAAVTHWSPNRIEIALSVDAPDILVVNQNFDPGWRVRAAPPRPASATRGLLSAPVGPGDERLTFYYRPANFVVGSWLSGVTGLALATACAVLGLRRRRRGQSVSASALTPRASAGT